MCFKTQHIWLRNWIDVLVNNLVNGSAPYKREEHPNFHACFRHAGPFVGRHEILVKLSVFSQFCRFSGKHLTLAWQMISANLFATIENNSGCDN